MKEAKEEEFEMLEITMDGPLVDFLMAFAAEAGVSEGELIQTVLNPK